MRNLWFIMASAFALVSCTQNKNRIPTVGQIDSVAIAMDTTMQKGFESSYEFHKTLRVHEKLVYDVVGYGGSASVGEYAILRRDANNKSDTMMKGQRNGFIADAFIADSNNNSIEEVYIMIQNPIQTSIKKTVRYEALK